jgi:hypothetical protein
MVPTTSHQLRDALARVPDPQPPPGVANELVAAVAADLASDAALRSLEADTYWPKWDSPWWHMLLLFELGEAARIPQRIVGAMVSGLDALPLHIFPIRPEEKRGHDPYRDSSCHCALGTMHQVLSACGVDVAARLPWIEPWFARYQMADGGLNCDETAYLVDECASSMVATIAPFEAMLGRPTDPFVERAAECLIGRWLVDGSPSRHNAEERDAAPSWLLPCFPRFYFYDVLRGLSALVRWATMSNHVLPLTAVNQAAAHLAAEHTDGIVRLRRRPWDGLTTMAHVDGQWRRGQPASRFPLLEATSALGRACPILTRQWSTTRQHLIDLIDRGRIADS